MVESNDVHFDENLERKDSKEEPKFLEFDISYEKVILNDLPEPYGFHKTCVQAEYVLQMRRGADARVERSTALLESEPKDIALDALTYYQNTRRTSRASAGEPPKRFVYKSANVAMETEDNDPESPLSYGDAICGPDAEEWI